MARGEWDSRQRAPRFPAFLLALAICAIPCSCLKPPEDTQGLWPGIYRGAADEPGSGFSEMSVDQAGKKEISFFLRLIQENGYSREISGKASYKGRTAFYSQDGIELSFTLEEGPAPAIIIADGATKILESEGFKPRLRLARESMRTTADGSGPAIPNGDSIPAATALGPETGSSFRFGYYLPEGADPNADALPESFAFMFFDKNGMTAKEISMFEGMTNEGRVLGTFTVQDDSIIIRSQDPKTRKKRELAWKRQGRDILVSDSGQRFFFWKDDIQK
jgi:hypothetical protein